MVYQKNTGGTSRKINVDAVSDKTVNQGESELGGVWEFIEIWRCTRGHAGEGGAERNRGADRKWYKRAWLCKTGLVTALVWLSPELDHHGLSYHFVSSY